MVFWIPLMWPEKLAFGFVAVFVIYFTDGQTFPGLRKNSDYGVCEMLLSTAQLSLVTVPSRSWFPAAPESPCLLSSQHSATQVCGTHLTEEEATVVRGPVKT